MNSLRNDVNDMFDKTHMRIKICCELYHGTLYIIYLANKGQVVAVVAVIVIVWKLELQLHVQLVHITTKVVSSW
jgi:hypothetical protein